MSNLLAKLSVLPYNKVAVIGVVFMLFYYLMLFDDGSVITEQIKSMQQQVSAEEVKKRDSEAALQEEAQVKQDVGVLAERFKEASAKLPNDLNSSVMIRAIQRVAKASGSNIKSIRPLKSFISDVVEGQPIDVQVEGEFGQLTLFIYYIASFERIAKMQNFRIVKTDEASKDNKLRLEGQVVSYRYASGQGAKQ